jgi:broad specificity phosphatase PhoE
VNAYGKAGSDSEPAFAVAAPLPKDTEWSRSGRHTSRTDLPLTAFGEDQARALAPLLAELRPALVLSSPRQRAVRTAEIAGLHVDGIDPDLAEWDYGEYEGLTTPEIRQHDPGWSVFTHPSPGGEAAAGVSARADRVLTRVIPSLSTGPVILFAHGHISRVIGARWIGLQARDGARLALGVAAPSVLGAEHGRPVILHWNMPATAARAAVRTSPGG